MELNREQIRYKMSEKQIKTALECLSKPNSTPDDRAKCYFMWKEPSCFSCYHEVAQNALALIKELTAKTEAQDIVITELRKLLEKANHDADRYALKIKELTEEVEQRIEDYAEHSKSWEKAYEKLELTLVGAMHFVDKWLDGKELEQDEVNRAATMREKTLQIVEKLTEENERLRADTVREFAERLRANRVNREGILFNVVALDAIDRVEKEMLEGLNDTIAE